MEPSIAGSFVRDCRADVQSPTTSAFGNRLPFYRKAVEQLSVESAPAAGGSPQQSSSSSEHLSPSVERVRRSVDELCSAADALHRAHLAMARSLDAMAQARTADALAREDDMFIGTALLKFSVMFNDLSTSTGNLARNAQNLLQFPLENLARNDLRERGELRRAVEKSGREYDGRLAKAEKLLKQSSKESGWTRGAVAPSELADELYKERTQLQLEICRYLLSSSKLSDRLGVDLIQQFIDFFRVQESIHADSLQLLRDYSQHYLDPLIDRVGRMRRDRDGERTELRTLESTLVNGLAACQEGSRLDRSGADGSKSDRSDGSPAKTVQGSSFMRSHAGRSSQRSSVDNNNEQKKSSADDGAEMKTEGDVWKRNQGKLHWQWRRRRARIENGCFLITHSDESEPPTSISLLTCDVKRPNGAGDKHFDLVCYDRTYNLHAESAAEAERWVRGIEWAKLGAQHRLFHGDTDRPQSGTQVSVVTPAHTVGQSRAVSNVVYTGVKDLADNHIASRQMIVEALLAKAGNDACADCAAREDSGLHWLSVSWGCVLCIQCAGAHRQLGVHRSRVHSLHLDRLSAAEMMVALAVGNSTLNSVLEARLAPTEKITPSCSNDDRLWFVGRKYVDLKYLDRQSMTSFGHAQMRSALAKRDCAGVLTALLAGYDVGAVWPHRETGDSGGVGDTALTHLIRTDAQCTGLPLLELMLAHGADPNAPTADGCSPLHVCAALDRPEHLKLLLRAPKVDPRTLNLGDKLTARQLGEKLGRGNGVAVELLRMFDGADGEGPRAAPLQADRHKSKDRSVLDEIRLPVAALRVYAGAPQQQRRGARQSAHSSASESVAHRTAAPAANDGELEAALLARRRSCNEHRQQQMSGRSSAAERSPPPPPLPPKRFPHLTSAHPSARQRREGAGDDDAHSGYSPSNRQGYQRSASEMTPNHVPPGGLAAGLQQQPTPVEQATAGSGLTKRATLPRSGNVPADSPHAHAHPFTQNGRPPSSSPPPLAHAQPPAVPPRSRHDHNHNDHDHDHDRQQSPAAKDRGPSTPPPSGAGAALKTCRALYACDADRPDELSFVAGELIEVLRERVDGELDAWMEGRIVGSPNRRGIFPATFVTFCERM